VQSNTHHTNSESIAITNPRKETEKSSSHSKHTLRTGERKIKGKKKM